MTRFICIHGHFYQPPRENPWSGSVEAQASAAPYHDWNERITAECYAPLARAGAYDRISFNFGPTLLGWMESADAATYRAIVRSRGPAMAQVFGHAILPLCNARDKQTQVAWGIRDFRHRFGRAPEGMWLPETAVDRASLETLARHGIRFTVLAPSQAARRVDPRKPYRCALGSGRSIDLFFYDGPVSGDVAFGELGEDGDRLAARLLGLLDAEDAEPQLAHIATDGETYGHHRRGGVSALVSALDLIEKDGRARLIGHGEFLGLCPPSLEVEIVENSSWSCAHELGRWQEDCGCSGGGEEGWRQAWRGPLRQALDWLRDELAPRFEAQAGLYLRDPWAARDDYVDLLLASDEPRRREFLSRHAIHELAPPERDNVWRLLELQRWCLLMYTSCGWFFEDLSRIETVQILRYAARAVELGEELFGVSIESAFAARLERARGNRPELPDGRVLYERRVRSRT